MTDKDLIAALVKMRDKLKYDPLPEDLDPDDHMVWAYGEGMTMREFAEKYGEDFAERLSDDS